MDLLKLEQNHMFVYKLYLEVEIKGMNAKYGQLE
jgi:hypothetical protein